MYSLNIMTQQKNCLPNLLFWLLFIYMMHVKIRKFFSWSCVSLKTLKLYRHFSFEKKLLWQILSLLIFFSFCFRITLILFWFLNYRLLLGNKSLIFFSQRWIIWQGFLTSIASLSHTCDSSPNFQYQDYRHYSSPYISLINFKKLLFQLGVNQYL